MQRIILVAACLVLGACAAGIGLAPPPNLYRTGTNYPEAGVPPTLRTAEPRIFYMTDRAPEGAGYGSARSQSMAFGAATIKFGRDLDWPELLMRTRADSDQNISTLWVPDVQELVRFEATPLPVQRKDGQLRHRADARDAYDAQARQFQARIAAEIASTGNRRVLVYIHGFNNAFEDSLTALANLWHFAGRQSVPVSFT